MMRRSSQYSGFTLLEVLIALSILALVFSGLYSAYNETLETTAIVENGKDVEQVARLTLGQMVDDFKCLYYHESEGNQKDSPYRFVTGALETEGEVGKVIEFASTAHLGLDEHYPSRRINRVCYLLEKQGETGPHYRLIRREYPFVGLQGEGQEIDFELADGVEEVIFTFVDAEGREAAQWDSSLPENSGKFPRLVRIGLRMAVGASGQSRLFAAAVAPMAW
jgi:type II secretion system protein J